MKYMIMMFGGLGATLQDRTPEWITGMHELMMKLDTELKEAGEVVASHGLVDPSQAKTVRIHHGAPVSTDGPFAEIKESLAGYWIVEASEERAIEIASQVVAYTEYPMEVRRIMHGDVAPQVLGTLVRRYGQFDACEDAVQQALLAAARQWPADGVPDRPRSWLMTVAGRALVDGWRADSARRRRETAAALDPTDHPPAGDLHNADTDDTLALLFLCCHPALSPPAQLALTLRAVGGLTTAQIAAAFLVPEATM